MRTNGIGTIVATVTITQYSMIGRHISTLTRHWKMEKAPTQKAKKWCEILLADPPRYVKTRYDSDSQLLNGICKEQVKLAKEESNLLEPNRKIEGGRRKAREEL